MARLALRLLLLAASFTRVSAGFYFFIIFNDDGSVNPLTYAVDGVLVIVFGLVFFFKMGRRHERAERQLRLLFRAQPDQAYTGAATSRLVENDGAELSSYAVTVVPGATMPPAAAASSEPTALVPHDSGDIESWAWSSTICADDCSKCDASLSLCSFFCWPVVLGRLQKRRGRSGRLRR